MRNKKLLLVFTAMMSVLTIGAGTACAVSHDSSDSSNASDSSYSESAEAGIILDRTSAELEVHETVMLTATAENTTETVVWSSSDPSVATVQDGFVQAQATGEVTITASAGGVSATCRITVYDAQSAPVLKLNCEYVPVAKGDTYTVKAEVLYKNQPAYGEIEYTWTPADDAVEGVASIEADGEEAVITGLEYGDTAYDVVAIIWGTTMTARVDVSVKNADIRFETSFESGEGAYTASLSLLDTGEHHTEADLDVKIYEKDVLLDGEITDWKSENEAIVKVSDGRIAAVSEGTAYVVGSWQNNECRILVSVYRPEIECDERVELESLGGGVVTLHTELEGSVKDMLFEGENILLSADGSSLTYDKTKLPVASAEMGEASIVVGTEKAKYVFPAGIYSRVIRSQGDLDAMAADGKAALDKDIFWDGYYVLGADIACDYGTGYYPSVNWPKSFDDNGINVYTQNAGFMGTFDGRGYNIDGLRTTSKRAFFLTMAKGGVVRNISFTNAFHAGGEGDAFLATYGHGVFENVYVELTSLSAGSGVFNGFEALSDARVKNCFVVCNTPSENTKLGYNNGTPSGSSPIRHFDGVYSVGLAADPSMPSWQVSGGYTNNNRTKNYTDLSSMAAAEIDFGNWNKDFWTIINGLPYPKNLSATAGDIVYEINVVGEYVGIGAEITYTSKDTILRLDEQAKAAGIVLGDGKIVIPDDKEMLGKSFTVTAKNRFGEETESKTFYVVNSSTFAATGSFEAEARNDEATFSLDLSADAGKIKGALSAVTVGEKKFSTAEYSNGILTLDRATIADVWGDHVLSATFLVYENDAVTEALTVEIDVLFITRIIENQTDFEAMATDGKTALNAEKFWYGYYILGNNIECDYTKRGVSYPSANWADSVPEPWSTDFGFNGVFDGRGHNISGVRTYGLGSVFIGIGSSGIVKNVSFTGAVHNPSDNYSGAFLCSYLCGTIENVYIQFDSINGGTAFNSNYPINDTLKVKNCFVEAVSAASGTNLGITCETSSDSRIPFENVYSVGLGKDAVCDDWGQVENYNITKNYSSRTEMAAAGLNFDGWDKEFWKIENGIPLPRLLESTRTVTIEKPLDVAMSSSGDTVTFDLSAYLGNMGTVSAVLDGNVISVSGTPAAVVFNKQELYAETYGNKTLVVTSVNGSETVIASAVLCVASHVVTTAAEYKEAMPGGAYVVLANDISFDGTDPDRAGKFEGIFDGRGYVLDGMTVGVNYVFCYTMNGVIRNVTITDLSLGAGTGLYGEGKGLAQNVYVQARSVVTGWASWHTGFFGSNNFLDYNRVKHCIIVVDSVNTANAGNVYGIGGHYDGLGYADGLYMIGATDRCMPVRVISSSDNQDNYAGYADRAGMKNAVESGTIGFADWDKDFWATDADGLPIPVSISK